MHKPWRRPPSTSTPSPPRRAAHPLRVSIMPGSDDMSEEDTLGAERGPPPNPAPPPPLLQGPEPPSEPSPPHPTVVVGPNRESTFPPPPPPPAPAPPPPSTPRLPPNARAKLRRLLQTLTAAGDFAGRVSRSRATRSPGSST